MRKFVHLNARTIDEAVSALQRYGAKASVIAGGTDLLGKMKDEILPTYPEAIINLKSIPGLDFIKEEEGMLRIGALTRLEEIATNSLMHSKYRALAEAAHRTASPHIREMGTIGGNICQDIRCWYYRNPYNRFPCLRKGGGRCYAIEGDNRYHSIFDSSVKGGCLAVHPSDTAPALIALNAVVKTSKRLIHADDFFEVDVAKTTILERDEIVIEIQVQAPSADTKSSFVKFAARKTIDFPVVNCAAMMTTSNGKVSGARICLNAVYVKPYRALKAEEMIRGKVIDEVAAKAVGEAAVLDAKPLRHNGYMVKVARAMVERAILACK
ncbi:MAG TPA: FAD binding domain-containing protein [Thermodesulfobacteriota bacterium]|jgi:xanthine dehydrogenase YagS FAD-binding subunit|nr:FAD binding domain-containing protein [Thermodesulfobacteriota bacterium]